MSQGLCPSCGAAVNLTAGQTETKCQYCQNTVTPQQAEAHSAKLKSAKGGGALLLANIALTSCDYAKALTFYDKAIEQDETLAEAWLGRGTCFAHITTKEYGSFRTKTTECLSSLDAAIQFAANQQAMAKRAAKVIAEAVGFGLDVEDRLGGRKGSTNYVYNDADYGVLLEWAIEKDQSEFVLKTGAVFFSRTTAYVDDSRLKDADGREFAAWLKLNADRYLKALRQINPEAASKCDNAFRKMRTTAQTQFQQEKAFKADIAGVMQRSNEYLAEETKKLERRTNGGCFIATACYGDYDHPVVVELRHFRDDHLETSAAGRAFVQWYYKWSPTFANLLAINGILKTLAKVLIVTPALTVARIINKNTRKD